MWDIKNTIKIGSYPSTPMASTNLALLALVAAKREKTPFAEESSFKTALSEGLGLLRHVQQSNGGMPYGGGLYRATDSEPGRTAGTLLALAALRETHSSIFQRAAEYVIRNVRDIPHGHACPPLHVALGALACYILSDETWRHYDSEVLEQVRKNRRGDGTFDNSIFRGFKELNSEEKRWYDGTTTWAVAHYALGLSADRLELTHRLRLDAADEISARLSDLEKKIDALKREAKSLRRDLEQLDQKRTARSKMEPADRQTARKAMPDLKEKTSRQLRAKLFDKQTAPDLNEKSRRQKAAPDRKAAGDSKGKAGPETKADAEPSCINVRHFRIPFKISDEERNRVGQIILFSCSPGSEHYRQEAVAAPDDRRFSFYAKNDGAYSFKIATLDKENKRRPNDVSTAPIAKTIIVDTTRPDVRITAAERRGDKVTVRQGIGEDHPKLSTLRLENGTEGMSESAWKTLAIMPALTGEIVVRLGTSEAATLRMKIDRHQTALSTATSCKSATSRTDQRRDCVETLRSIHDGLTDRLALITDSWTNQTLSINAFATVEVQCVSAKDRNFLKNRELRVQKTAAREVIILQVVTALKLGSAEYAVHRLRLTKSSARDGRRLAE